MKTFLKLLGIVMVIAIIAVVTVVIFFEAPKLTDYGYFEQLRTQTVGLFKQHGATVRPITAEFESFVLELGFPYSKLFGNKTVGVPIVSYASDAMAVGTLSRFEIPPGSGYSRDYTLNVRPAYSVKAPVLHIDFMKPAPGTSGLCILDFFNVDKEVVKLDEFFGNDITSIETAHKLVAPYQRTGADGRGKITKYLDPYKSPYRFELKEPPAKDEAARTRIL